MIIGVAGQYTAPTVEKRKAHLDAMNVAAAHLLEMGRIPIIGMNAALAVLEQAIVTDRYDATMRISLAVISVCDALLLIGESSGANIGAGGFASEAARGLLDRPSPGTIFLTSPPRSRERTSAVAAWPGRTGASSGRRRNAGISPKRWSIGSTGRPRDERCATDRAGMYIRKCSCCS